jgi:hypothetical protein
MNDRYDNEKTDRELSKIYPGIGLTNQEADGLMEAVDRYAGWYRKPEGDDPGLAFDPEADSGLPFNQKFTKTEEKIRRAALRGWSQRRLDFGEASDIRAFLTGNSNECPDGYHEKYRAAQERFSRNGKQVYVYRLIVVYPEGSHAPGWKPTIWGDKEFLKTLPLRVRLSMPIRPAKFRWPRERMFMSSDSAWGRAHFLKACGAEVTVLRSQPVTWIEGSLEEFAGIKSNW